jgi:uncharacterized pyridoxal phosphate-containing UPF0001 family protein
MREVKLSPEEAKHGVDPDGLPALIEAVSRCANLLLNGLMTMPPWSENAYFRRLRELALQHGMAQLSMGMIWK